MVGDPFGVADNDGCGVTQSRLLNRPGKSAIISFKMTLCSVIFLQSCVRQAVYRSKLSNKTTVPCRRLMNAMM